MPRPTNPGSIKTGPGKTTPGQTDEYALVGAGMVGLPPNIGEPGFIPPGGIVPEAGYPMPPLGGVAGTGAVLLTHLNDPSGAHSAIAISIDGHPPLIFSENVEGALDELMGAIAPEPPKLGEWLAHITPQFDCVPDWGEARMDDGPVPHEEPPGNTETGEEVYPCYWTAPTPVGDVSFLSYGLPGEDPYTDPIWNHIPSSLGVGLVEVCPIAGGYTDPVTDGVVRTRLFTPLAALPWATEDAPVINLSGALHPADRGVLALVHFPSLDSGTAFLDQTLEERCWAALLLGQGLYQNPGCIASPTPTSCDGDVGGIFAPGEDADGNYDPFAYPGRASGQYDLEEMHTGLSGIDGSALPAAGAPRVKDAIIPGAGQVRLGTDPDAGEIDPTDYGIPILGASVAAYSPVVLNNASFIPPTPTLGRTVVAPDNFFRYRLPYLDDYSQSTGLKYTPRGETPIGTRETGRYFEVALPYNTIAGLVETVGGADRLVNAGAYGGFDQDYWTWQLARYKQFFFQSEAVVAGRRIGTNVLIHFKTEADFETCVRDGVMPWDAADGYETYGVTPQVDPLVGVPDTYADLVNRKVVGDIPPTYGYEGNAYNVLRENMFLADTVTTPTPDVASEWSYDVSVPPLDYMYVSGVAYMVPLHIDGTTNFRIATLYAEFANAWDDGYRVDDNPMTGDPSAEPSSVSSANPALLSLSHFAYDTVAGTPTYNIPGGTTDARGERRQRVEFPFTFTGLFTENLGPTAADALVIQFQTAATLDGDVLPAFATNAAPRVFVRRPTTPPMQPVSADGLGYKLPLSGALTDQVLFHSTGFHLAAGVGVGSSFGNFVDATPRAWGILSDATKDVSERFLDEVYRIKQDLPIVGWPAAKIAALVGPGMGTWAGGPAPVPVQIGNTAYIPAPAQAVWDPASWLQEQDYLTSVALVPELQAAGQPDRNPPPENWIRNPFASAGVLLYPQTDYTTNFRPAVGELSGADTQFDYSAAAGLREYIRAFDAAFSRDATLHWAAAGQATVTFRIDGLVLGDFAFTGVGPGALAIAGQDIAIMIKVPGLTTWMDVGRRDGDGPSKQDAFSDGAGCQVVGPYTFTGVDPDTGAVFSQIRIHVGPVATLAAGYSIGGGTPRDEVPVLVKVMAGPDFTNYDLTMKATVPGTFLPAVADPAVWAHRVRGIQELSLVHPDNVLAPTAAELSAWEAYMDPATGPGA